MRKAIKQSVPWQHSLACWYEPGGEVSKVVESKFPQWYEKNKEKITSRLAMISWKDQHWTRCSVTTGQDSTRIPTILKSRENPKLPAMAKLYVTQSTCRGVDYDHTVSCFCAQLTSTSILTSRTAVTTKCAHSFTLARCQLTWVTGNEPDTTEQISGCWFFTLLFQLSFQQRKFAFT